jgi:hypothetical protein
VSNQAIVIVIPSADIPVTGFNYGAIQFCGYHSYSGNIAYGFVGDSSVTTWCQGQPTASNNLGADSMGSVLIHEIEEATSDPILNAWASTNGYENADKCAWNFGTFSTNAPYYNYSWLSTNYLIQQEFALNNLYTPISGINGTAPKSASSITLSSTSGLSSGMYIFGSGIPANAYISSINLTTKVISIAVSNRTTTVSLALSNTPLTFSTTNFDPSKYDVWNGACSK